MFGAASEGAILRSRQCPLSNGTLDFAQASEEYERALALAPGHAQVLRSSGLVAAWMGHFPAGITASRRAVVLPTRSWIRSARSRAFRR